MRKCSKVTSHLTVPPTSKGFLQTKDHDHGTCMMRGPAVRISFSNDIEKAKAEVMKLITPASDVES